MSSTLEKTAATTKTQSQRREETQQKVLDSACQIFAEKGYANTSLQDIADALNLTISPIYHYYGNKISLFTSVTEHMELRLAEELEKLAADDGAIQPLSIWNVLIDVAKQPGFVQIVLKDAPHFLGRDRWRDTSVVKAVATLLDIKAASQSLSSDFSELDQELILRMVMASFAEVALMIGSNPDYDSSQLIAKIIRNWI
ncbi:MAG: TetR/AcrR family transcriptional regulator [Spongiibacteraceae bacterium]